MYHPKTNNFATNTSFGSEAIPTTGSVTAKALAILFMPPALQLFMPLRQKNSPINTVQAEDVSYKASIASSVVDVVASPEPEQTPEVESETPEVEITNENAGSIKATGMMHHLRHTKN